MEIDSRKTAQLVLVSFSLPLGQVVRQLSDNEEVLYSFLQGVFEYRLVLIFGLPHSGNQSVGTVVSCS